MPARRVALVAGAGAALLFVAATAFAPQQSSRVSLAPSMSARETSTLRFSGGQQRFDVSRCHRQMQPLSNNPYTSAPMQSRFVRANAEEDEDFEQRLNALQSAGRRMTKEDATLEKSSGKSGFSSSKSNPYEKKKYDFTGETVYFEGPPHRGDAVVNTVLGASLVWLPLTVAALTRAASINYVITDKRVSVVTKAPWAEEATRVDAPYDQIKKVQTVGRGIGLWGDMAVTMVDNNVLEFRSLGNYQEIEKYIRDRIPQREDNFEEDYQTY